MKKYLFLMVFGCLMSLVVFAKSASDYKTDVDDAAVITQLLHDFLAGASINDAKMHDRFWSEELIYTSSSGLRYGKSQIMESMKDIEAPDQATNPELVYTSEDLEVRLYGDVAIVAFTLVATPQTADSETIYFLNSGTLVKSDGVWQVVNWQATRKAVD
jgi:ketosteroid isomerase-like protein